MSTANHISYLVWMPNNWGLTQHELATVPPFLIRGLTKLGGLGSELPKVFGRVLMNTTLSSMGPSRKSTYMGRKQVRIVWLYAEVHYRRSCVRMSGLWDY